MRLRTALSDDSLKPKKKASSKKILQNERHGSKREDRWILDCAKIWGDEMRYL